MVQRCQQFPPAEPQFDTPRFSSRSGDVILRNEQRSTVCLSAIPNRSFLPFFIHHTPYRRHHLFLIQTFSPTFNGTRVDISEEYAMYLMPVLFEEYV